MGLDGKSKRKLRALGHHLEPVVLVGHQGVTDAVVGAVEQALYDHELIKVKVNEGPEDRHEVAQTLATRTEAEVAQVLGRTVLLFKPREEDSKFDLRQPDARAKVKAAAGTGGRKAPAKASAKPSAKDFAKPSAKPSARTGKRSAAGSDKPAPRKRPPVRRTRED